MTAALRPPAHAPYIVKTMEVTGYCNCGECCNWRHTWLGLGSAVIATGPRAGQPKEIGVTASGATARHGTVAADTTFYPFGTVVYIPGYGYGRVEDTGGAIKDQRLDLWFDSHEEALRWGRQRKLVKIWLPSAPR